jgi:hypothetical protein
MITKRLQRSFCLLLALAAVLLSGCVWHKRTTSQERTFPHNSSGARQLASETELVFTCRSEGNDVVLASDKLTLIFPDLRRHDRKAFDGEEFWIQIGGEGSSEVVRSYRRNWRNAKFHARYKDGVNTIQFCGREVRLENGARKVIVGEKTFELTPDEKIVRVLARAE